MRQPPATHSTPLNLESWLLTHAFKPGDLEQGGDNGDTALLQAGAEVNARNNDGNNALRCACLRGFYWGASGRKHHSGQYLCLSHVYPMKIEQGGTIQDILAALQRAIATSPPPWLAKILGVGAEQRVKNYQAAPS